MVLGDDSNKGRDWSKAWDPLTGGDERDPLFQMKTGIRSGTLVQMNTGGKGGTLHSR